MAYLYPTETREDRADLRECEQARNDDALLTFTAVLRTGLAVLAVVVLDG